MSEEQLAPPASVHPKIIFGLIVAAVFLDVVDFSIVQIALPTIRDQFSVTLADSQWVIGAYGITMAGFLILSGRAGDIYGQKKLFITGIVVFTVASLTAGFAPTLLTLIASRAVQGLGAAISTVTAFAILIATYPDGNERNKAFGILGALLSAGFAAGSLAGGVLTATFGWPSVFFVNVPIGIVAAALSQRYMSGGGGRMLNGRLDVPGALTVTGGLTLLVYALTNASNLGFASPWTAVPLVLSAIALASFIAIELRSKAPLVPLGFLRRGSVLTANVIALVFTSLSAGLGFILTFYLQLVLGYSPLFTAIVFLPPAMLFLAMGAWGFARIMRRFSLRSVVLASLVLVTAGCALLTQISATGTYLGVIPGLALWALGASIGFPVLSIAAVAGARPGEEGLASGLIGTSSRVGFPLGLATLLTIASLTDPQPIGGSQLASAIAAVTGFQYAFLASAIMGLVGILIALRIKNPPPYPMAGPPPSATTEPV
jgi:MFS family permease